MEKHTTIAIDLSKSVFQVAVSDRPGRIRERKRLSKSQMLSFFAHHPPATVLMEACGSAHHWARELQNLGHFPRLLPPHHTRRYVLRDKTDAADATALLEANRNEQISPVPVKTLHQHTLASLHRIRSAWIQTRTARLNTVRGLLRELGLSIPQGPRHVLPRLSHALSDDSIPQLLHTTLLALASEIRALEQNIKNLERQLACAARSLPDTTRHLSIPGIGLLTATALAASVGTLSRFPSGRRFASFLGLVPKEHSSGNHRHLGTITKRGDPYLRTLLIHGARSVLLAAKRAKNPDPLSCWALNLERRRGHNRAAVALANKLARIAWAVSTHQTNYQAYVA